MDDTARTWKAMEEIMVIKNPSSQGPGPPRCASPCVRPRPGTLLAQHIHSAPLSSPRRSTAALLKLHVKVPLRGIEETT